MQPTQRRASEPLFIATGEAVFNRLAQTLEKCTPTSHEIDPKLEERLTPVAEAISGALWHGGCLTFLPATFMWLLTILVPLDYSSVIRWAPCWLGCLVLPPIKGDALCNLLLCAYACFISLEPTAWVLTRAVLCLPMALCTHHLFTMALLGIEEIFKACTGRPLPTRVFWEKHDDPAYLHERIDLLVLLVSIALPFLLLRWWVPIPVTPMLVTAFPVWAAGEELLPRLQRPGSVLLGSSRLAADVSSYAVPIAACAYSLRSEAVPIYAQAVAGLLMSIVCASMFSAAEIACGRKRLGERSKTLFQKENVRAKRSQRGGKE